MNAPAISSELAALLDACSADLTDTTALLITADKAYDENQSKLEWLLRWLAADQRLVMFTGSRCYGTPKPDSDWDWVLMMPGNATRKMLAAFAEPMDVDRETNKDVPYPDPAYPGQGRLDMALRFGPVNLIIVSEDIQWEVWEVGTDTLLMERPVTRDRAIAVFTAEYERRLREEQADEDAAYAAQMETEMEYSRG